MAAQTHYTAASNFGANLLGSEYVDRNFVEALWANAVFLRLGRKADLPQGSSKKVRLQYFSSPSAATTSIDQSSSGEGSDPPAAVLLTFTTTTAEITLQEWGTYGAFSKFWRGTTTPGSYQEILMGVAEHAAVTLDRWIQAGSLNSESTGLDAGTALTAEDLRSGASTMHTNKVKYHPESPGGNFFCFVGTPAALYDMMGEGAPTWSQVKDSDLASALVTPFRDTPASAAIYDVICKRSTNIQTGGGDDLMYMIGKDYYGCASLEGMSDAMRPRVLSTEPEELVSAPLRNRGTFGWWCLFNATVIDSNRGIEVHADT